MDIAALRKGYSLGKTLGEGSFGKVKSAYSHKLKCNVAIKIIDKKKIAQGVLEKFLPREIEALKCLHHPSIIETYEIFETSVGKLYIVMELGEKGNLMNYLETKGAMEEDFASSKFQQLASAIKHCHDLDFAHRDLKCDNVLVDNYLNFKLTDFGFSKHLSRDENGKIILSNTFCGSLTYSAPEVHQHIPCDPRISDMWSLGVILYMMLYISKPFDTSDVMQMVRVQKQHRIPFLNSKHLTAECKHLIYHLLQPDVSQRMCIDEVLKHPWLQTPNLSKSSKANPILLMPREWRKKMNPPKDHFNGTT
ncbi:PREDICTED: testis-specific serine/threonine-protein kinase 3, partial [Acanthisitta chloris]|uniref:testis-specific serine/threonine-protein kinase 3 n=1 Tax=Acanthisitta chloris TaxID=57068 RepID=UPI0004F0CB9E